MSMLKDRWVIFENFDPRLSLIIWTMNGGRIEKDGEIYRSQKSKEKKREKNKKYLEKLPT